MADVSKINLFGTDYTIKDKTARTAANSAESSASEAKTAADNAQTTADNAQTTADSANSKATANSTKITKLATEGIVVSYESSDESINVTKGIDLA